MNMIDKPTFEETIRSIPNITLLASPKAIIHKKALIVNTCQLRL